VPGGCVGGSVEPLAGGWSLPGPRELIEADPSVLSAPHHDYPAWDWIIPENTPIYAVRGGRVVSIRSWPHNWWTHGCGTQGGGDCSTCGVGLTIEDAEGIRWTYCHGTNVTVPLGAEVIAHRPPRTHRHDNDTATPKPVVPANESSARPGPSYPRRTGGGWQ
jgi:hypothetical protein